jgi:23S rRNA (guanosine2251-2'-O)-methyltransferase
MTDRSGRADRSRDRFVIGGRRAVLEALRSGLAVSVMVSAAASRRPTPGLGDVLDAASRANVRVERVPDRTLDEAGVRDHQGVVATVRRPRDLDERGLLSMPFEDESLVVMLDGVEDPQNLGACARSAEAASVTALVLRRRRAAGVTAAAVRASAGALLHVPVATVTNLARTAEDLKDAGFFVAGLDHDAAATIHDGARPPGRLALVLGGEGAGISRLVRERCDVLVRIPTPGRVGSLNAAAALAVGLFGYARRPRPADAPTPDDGSRRSYHA